jgi:hypothetical protein
MRTLRATLVGASLAAALGLSAAGASADTREEQLQKLQQMRDRMSQLDDRLAAATDSLEATNQRADEQAQLIEHAGLDGAPPASSGLAGFLEALEVEGWMSGEYWYNFNDPDGENLGGANVGGGGGTNPFNRDANSFQFSQFWLGVEHPVSGERRAGFRADLVFGDDAGTLSGGNTSTSGGEEDFHVYQAYVQYLAPLGEGVTFKFGKFGTLIGAETVHDNPDANFNISRSNVYNLLQPITHTGILASMNLTEDIDFSAGVVNENRGAGGLSGVDIDSNNKKSATWHLGWTGEKTGISFNGIWGGSTITSATGAADEEADELILDLILRYDPTEKFSTYVNFDWLTQDGDSDIVGSNLSEESEAWGVSWAGKYQLTERLSQALRLDYIDDDGCVIAPCDPGGDVHIWTVTATTGFELTNNLMLRGEVRYDDASVEGVALGPNQNDFFASDSSGSAGSFNEGHQILVGANVVYSF